MVFTAEQLIKKHGVALRWERADNEDNGAWVAAFHFAGPDMVSQGATIETALENFLITVSAYQQLEKEQKPGGTHVSVPDAEHARLQRQ